MVWFVVMAELSISPLERSRKAHARILQAMQVAGTGSAMAVALGVSESTISRLKNEALEGALSLLYHAGFKVVDGDRVCVQRDELNMLRNHYARTVAMQSKAAELFGDVE